MHLNEETTMPWGAGASGTYPAGAKVSSSSAARVRIAAVAMEESR
jgi:hypothetical protein